MFGFAVWEIQIPGSGVMLGQNRQIDAGVSGRFNFLFLKAAAGAKAEIFPRCEAFGQSIE